MRKYDSIWLGVLLGILVPLAISAFVYIPVKLKGGSLYIAFGESMQLFLIVVNGILLRFLLGRWDMEPTGKGMMAVTLLMAILWVVHNYL